MTMSKQHPDQPRRPTGQDGFTLIELLVVMAILGLLVAIATPRVLKHLDTAKVSTAEMQIGDLSTALDTFKLDVGRYPTTQEGLAALIVVPAGLTKWNGPYLKGKEIPADPWGHAYIYRSPGEQGDYDLSTQGPDNQGKSGG